MNCLLDFPALLQTYIGCVAPVTKLISTIREIVTIPEQLAIYKETYITCDNIKPKNNRYVVTTSKKEPSTASIIITHQTVFLFDITGSMQSIIDSVKQEIVPVMKRLEEEAVKAVSETISDSNSFVLNFEIAVVGYRDFCDNKHFETHDFTSKIQEIEEFLKSLEANGGGDEPEDVKGAFVHALFGISDKANILSWKTDTASKSIYLITDAPAHGLLFHSSSKLGDNYYNDSDDEWKIILSNMKLNEIMFNIIKINRNTTKMCNTFQNMCKIQEIKYIEIDISQQISDSSYRQKFYGDRIHDKYEERDECTLKGTVEMCMSSIYRMTSTGYAHRSSSRISKLSETTIDTEK
jgi:hypothetical protein